VVHSAHRTRARALTWYRDRRFYLARRWAMADAFALDLAPPLGIRSFSFMFYLSHISTR